MKKLLLTILLIFTFCGSVWATQKYPIVGGGTWEVNGTWNTAPGQAVGNTTVPVAADAVTLDPLAVGQVTVTTSGAVCNTLICQSANNQLVINSGCSLLSSGAITLAANMTLTAADSTSIFGFNFPTGGIVAYDCNTVVWGGEFMIKGGNTTAITITLSENATVGKYHPYNLNTGTISLNSNTLTCTNGAQSDANATGTSALLVTGGRLEAPDSSMQYHESYEFGNSITLSTGAVTIADGFHWGGTAGRVFTSDGTATVTCESGSEGGFTFVGSGTYTATAAQIPLVDMTYSAGTITLSNDLYLTGTYYGSSSSTALNGNTIYTIGISGTGGTGGTTNFVLGDGSGGGDCSWIRTGTGIFGNSLEVNCSTCTIATANGAAWGAVGKTLTYTAGTITWGGGLTIFPATCTLTGWTGTGAIGGNLNLGSTAGQVITLGSDLTATATTSVTQGNNMQFTGAYDTYLSTLLLCQGSGASQYLAIPQTKTMTVNTLLQVVGVYGLAPVRYRIISGSAETKANINYSGTWANQQLWGVTLTDINATGKAMNTWCGVVNTSTNCFVRTSSDIGGAGVSITSY